MIVSALLRLSFGKLSAGTITFTMVAIYYPGGLVKFIPNDLNRQFPPGGEPFGAARFWTRFLTPRPLPCGCWTGTRRSSSLTVRCAKSWVLRRPRSLAPNVAHQHQGVAEKVVGHFVLDDIGVDQVDGPLEKEQTFLHADGQLHDYRVIRAKVLGDDRQVEGLLGLALDITCAQKGSAVVSGRGKKRFRDIALSVGDLIWEVGPDWRFRYLSEKACSILGYPVETLLGKSLAEMDHAAEAKTWQLLFHEWEKTPGTFRNVEKWLRHKDGRQRCLLLSGVPIVDEDGMPDGFRGVAEDITPAQAAGSQPQECFVGG